MPMAQHSVHSHYETLRIDRNASAAQIRTAYRMLAQVYHPDRYQGPGQSSEHMAAINAAYAVLSDFSTRVRYDSELAMEERRLNPAPPVRPRGSGGALRLAAGKPVMLVFGTAALAVTVSGFAAMNMLAPKRDSLQVMGAAPPVLEVSEPMPLVASQSIRPWAAPAQPLLPAADGAEPVLRLVSESSMKNPALRRHAQASAQ